MPGPSNQHFKCSHGGKVKRNEQEALIMFQNEVSANTATMLSNAKLQEQTIAVAYYFEEFNGQANQSPVEGAEGQNSRDHQANKMVSEWMAKGALMTDQLVSNGNDFLRKYGVIDKIEQAKTVAINQAAKIDEQYHIKQKAQEVNEKFQLSQRFAAAKDYVVSTASQLHQTAIQNPIGKSANDLITKTAKQVDATINESKRLYDNKKQEQKMSEIPLD